MYRILTILLCLLFAVQADAGTISKQGKSFGGTSFINGVVPQASDFNGDMDVIYGEFNGNIDNANIKTAAAIAASKINPDGFTVNLRTIHTGPCTILEESDQAADSKRWATCSNASVFQLGTYTDANALQNNWLTITRANGGFNIGGTSGTNTISGATTFNQAVTFVGGTSISPTGQVVVYPGTSPPTGWLIMDGSSNSCTGASGVNGPLCATLVGLYTATTDYKGAISATITVDTGSNEIIHTTHGKATNDRVHFNNAGGALPAPLVATTVYCIISTTTDRYKISTTCGGAEVDITTAGSGTSSDYFNFTTPDMRNAIATGYNSGTFSTSASIVDLLPKFASEWPTSTGSGSTAAHEGTVTIAGNQALDGVHYYTNFTLNSGVTVTLADNSHRLVIVASGTITINGTIDGIGAGAPGGVAVGVGLAGLPGQNGTTQAGGGAGATNADPGGAGGAVLWHGLTRQVGGTGGVPVNGSGAAATTFSGTNTNFDYLSILGGAGGGSGANALDSSSTGGRGGGSIVLIAPTIVLANTATLNSSGSAGTTQINDSGGAGGGGAGNIYIVTRSYTDNGATFTMSGGAAGSGTGGSGNGGAGAAGVKQINIYANPTSLLKNVFLSYIIKL